MRNEGLSRISMMRFVLRVASGFMSSTVEQVFAIIFL